MSARPWLVRTQYEYGRFLLGSGAASDRARGMELLAESQTTAAALGMRAIAQRVEYLLGAVQADGLGEARGVDPSRR